MGAMYSRTSEPVRFERDCPAVLVPQGDQVTLPVGSAGSITQALGLLGTPSIADPFHQDRWDYTASERTGRRGAAEVKNLTLWFENDALARWEGDYFPERDAELVNEVRRAFGPNLPRERNQRRR